MPKVRAHGDGALFQTVHQGRMVWRGVIDDGFTEDGRRKQRAVQGKTKSEVQAKLTRMKRERETLGRVLDRSTRFEDASSAWLREVAHSARPRTVSGYRSQLRASVNPVLGRKIISELTPGDIRRMHHSVRARGGSDSNVSAAHRVAVSVLEWCRRERMIAENVASLTPPKKTKTGKAKGSLTREEARKLLGLEDPRWILSLSTGMRSGEARGLRISELDLENGRAWVSWSHTEAGYWHGCGAPIGGRDDRGRLLYPCGRKVAGACPHKILDLADELEFEVLQDRHVLVRPKNHIVREVPLRPEVVIQLERHLDEAGPNPHGLVWHRADGSPLTNKDDNDALRRALLRAGIDRPTVSTHWLRHSYTTLAEHAGIAHAAYSSVSGHSSIQASNPYRHDLTAEGRRAVDSLVEWLTGAADI